MKRVTAVAVLFSLPIFTAGCMISEKLANPETDANPVPDSNRSVTVKRYGREFQIMKTNFFEIYYVPEQLDVAQRAGDEVDAIYSRLSEWFNLDLVLPYKIYLLPDKRTIHKATGEMRDIGGAVTERSGVMFIAGQHYNPHVIAHELTHIFIRRKMNRRDVPTWFNEGMAEYMSTPNPTADHMINFIRERLKNKELYTWKELDRGIMLREPDVTYMEALSAIIFLCVRFGEDKLKRLVETYGQEDYGKSFPAAIAEVYGIGYKSLEDEWRRFIRGEQSAEIRDQ